VGTGGLSPEVEQWIALLTEDQKDPDEHGASLRLDVDPLVEGELASFTVQGAVPGERAFFLYGPRGIGAGPCIGLLGGLCIDLVPPFQIFATANADAGGTASVRFPIPPGAAGHTASMQAILRRGSQGARSVKTNAVRRTVGSQSP